ncbi:MAG: TniQ family protein [Anaerolineae bacterium]|nr:TniQ family protein [Anaerolineae bacterium]
MTLRPFLNRTSLYPGESLQSLLTRLVKLNVYPSLRTVQDIVQVALEKPYVSIERPRDIDVLQALFELTGIDKEQLFLASANRFVAIARPEQFADPFEVKTSMTGVMDRWRIGDYLRNDSQVVFCPDCLKEEPYHRLDWSLFASVACLTHRCLLHDRCPECKKKLSIAEVVGAQCSSCRSNLAAAPTIDLEEDDFGLSVQNIIRSWLMHQPADPKFISSLDLPNEPEAILFQVLSGLYRVLKQAKYQFRDGWHSRMIVSPTPRQTYDLFTMAFKVLMHWPFGWFDFLDNYPKYYIDKRSQRRHNLGLNYIYRSLLEQRWKSEQFEFVRAAFDHYLILRHEELPGFTKHLPGYNDSFRIGFVTMDWAARTLGVSSKIIMTLVNAGFLRLDEQNYPGRNPWFMRRVSLEDVINLHEQWQSGCLPSEVAQILNVPEVIIDDLVRHGYILTANDMSEKSSLRIDRDSVFEFLAEARGTGRRSKSQNKSISKLPDL